MTEPTRDEINRALAEWAGWTYSPGVGWETPAGRTATPNYVESLDAQMPLWERAGVVNINIDRMGDLWCLFLDLTAVSYHCNASTIPEAAARALYAVLQQEVRDAASE